MDVPEALGTVYGDSVRLLTADGYVEAMRELRKNDPARARRVERALDPYLKQNVFSRRALNWHENSEGTLVRLALLAENPHLEKDVGVVRRALSLPAGHVQVRKADPRWEDVQRRGVKPKDIRRILEGDLIGWWLVIHRTVAMGRQVSQEPADAIGAEFRKSAEESARVNFRLTGSPEWLASPPRDAAPYESSASPIDWAAGRLIERHRLPWSMVTALTFHILSRNKTWLTGHEPLEVEIAHGNSSDPWAFTVAIKGVDEFVTKDDWDRVWYRYVHTRQKELWQLRGMKPAGRRSLDIARLKETLPYYRKMVLYGLAVKDVLGQNLDRDDETIRRAIHDLEDVLTPVP